MTWPIIQELLKLFGIPATGLLVLLYLSKTGQIRWGREAEQSEKDFAAERADWQRQLADMTKDRDYYRDFTMETLDRYGREVSTSETAVRTTETAARTAVRATSRRRS